jgi:hypothetical protein
LPLASVTRGGLLERYWQPVIDVGATGRCRPRPSAEPAEPAARRAAGAPGGATEQTLEDVAQIAGIAAAEFEMGGTRARPEPARACTAIAERRLGVAVIVDLAAIILCPLVLVGQQIVRRGDLAEAIRRLGIVLVAVGMKLLGELAVRLLDLGFVRAARHAQFLIQVCHLPRFA